MKCVKLAAAIALCLGMGQAFAAQTCASPTPLTAAGVSGVDGCAAADTIDTLCIFNANPSPDVVFSFQLVTGFTATTISLTNSTAGFNPQMILQAACGDSTDCTVSNTPPGAGANTSLSLTTGNSPGSASPGTTYFLVVDGASTTSATDCGTFGLTVNGSLPVQLQKFSVD